ncbi:unnamed protein product [Phyllotreta striolata]|uniref:MYND-type domain-containing protein n=1 Tax=Phyllotreta striolata TaxID=444603 RepID=A0A9N9TX57_PHYSR|nr:unnamed protein product [Phyllotreta striolata]
MSETNLSETEKQIFKAIETSDAVLLKTLLADAKNVNIIDENSMTPLQHAAYKGNKDLVQALLDQGADVNYGEHQHNYTSLHFAALSGNSDVCLALLLAGAKSQAVNTVGRTPAQMAAFVGHHECVAAMNSFIPKEDVDYYTITPGATASKTQILPAFLSESFHKFIMRTNVHPIKVILNVQTFVGLADHLAEVKKVLELMCERELKREDEKNEVMAFKFHYLSYVIGEMLKVKQKQMVKTDDDKKLDLIELFTRKLLKPGKDIGQLDIMDAFLRDCVREFPHRECTLFRQMVASLAGKDPPSALSVLASAINGQMGFVDSVSLCHTCGEPRPSKKCSKCKAVQYCDRNCQRLHWHWHKKACPRLSQTLIEDAQARPDAAALSAELRDLLVDN